VKREGQGIRHAGVGVRTYKRRVNGGLWTLDHLDATHDDLLEPPETVSGKTINFLFLYVACMIDARGHFI